MTGTAATESTEFESIYKLKVTIVPTNKPMIRKVCSTVSTLLWNQFGYCCEKSRSLEDPRSGRQLTEIEINLQSFVW